jgi:hypothetical protein
MRERKIFSFEPKRVREKTDMMKGGAGHEKGCEKEPGL